MYFVRNGVKQPVLCERHRIKIPTLGWVRLKEKGYIPTNPETHIIKSGSVSMKAGRCFCSSRRSRREQAYSDLESDLGLKDLVVCLDGRTFKNINKTNQET